MFYPALEAHSGPSQVSEMDLFAMLVNGFKLMLLNISGKVSSCMFEKVLNTSLTSSNADN